MSENTNTNFIAKSLSPAAQQMSGPMERWLYNLVNAGLVGGATAITSAGGFSVAHVAGVADVPAVNFHILGIMFLSGAIGKIAVFLSQGLPALTNNNQP